jgi:diguanylate cyclase (GGDEF)-like protein
VGEDAGFSGRRWQVAVAAIVVVGLAASLTASSLWRSSVRARERQTFETSAAHVGGALGTMLRRDADFVKSLRAVLTLQPNLSAGGFDRWFALLEDDRGQPAGFGALIVESVPAAKLAAFQARRNADPAFRALVGGQVESIAPTGRAHYCLLSGGTADVLRAPEVVPLLQQDWCDPSSLIGGYRVNGTTRAHFTQTITDDGQFGAYAIAGFGASTLIIEAAAYRQGARLAGVAQRRASVLGWVLGSFDIPALMRSAVGGDRGLAVSLYHENSGLGLELIGHMGATGTPRAFTHQATLQMDGGWIVKVAGDAAVSGPSANLQALVVLLGGIVASLLLAALVLVLARSREHAIGMVREKTGQLRHQAMHDALTGLPNRILALDRVEQMLARARRGQFPVAALYVDVDGFKAVNDSFGHAAGDELLRTVGKRLESVVREGDTAARIGGDEFVVLVEGSTLDAGAELVAERLLEVLSQPYEMSGEAGRELSVTASIGIALGLRAGADELLRDADIAMYEAKAAGKNRYVLFQSTMQTAVQDRLTLQMDLADAIERGELFLLYQPTFDLRSEHIIGVEALIRWRHPTRGTVPPMDFIPIAEATGLIVPIGRWVLREACRRAAAWHAQGHGLGMSVNISARQLDNDELIDAVRDALADSGLRAAALTLEITETALMRDPEATAARLSRLKQLGVRVAIDDFGTGYSSLAYLRQFPADVVKIDRSFISGIADSRQSTALIHTLVQLAKALGMETLAEGIEEQAQLETLQRQRCDHGQGFLFSRPLEVDAVEAFLRSAETRAGASPQRSVSGAI